MIAHFNSNLAGGAGVASLRLHYALRRQGIESLYYYGSGDCREPSLIPAYQNKSFVLRNLAALATSWRRRRQTPDGFLTGPGWIRKTPILRIRKMPLVVNLHWVARWLDLPSFFHSLQPELPVVWSLHDLIPITGGCHYPGECNHFEKQCGNCPQQKNPGPRDDTQKFFHCKNKLYANKNLHFVGNSEWTTSQICRSGLFKHAKSVRTIHLGLDVEEYKPVYKLCARQALGIPKGFFVVGFACSDFSEERKGAKSLLEALRALQNERMFLVTFGAGSWPLTASIDTLHLGPINSPRLQSLFYSALDVFATPSRVETFGNTAMEAMACETPVVAYATSGLLDLVKDGETGMLDHDIGSVSGLVRMLRWMHEHPKERTEMGLAARRRVLANFADSLMAERYAKLYEDLLAPGATSTSL